MRVYGGENETETVVRLGGNGLSRRALIGLGCSGVGVAAVSATWALVRRHGAQPSARNGVTTTSGTESDVQVSEVTVPQLTAAPVDGSAPGQPGSTEGDAAGTVPGDAETKNPSSVAAWREPIVPNEQGWSLWGTPQHAFDGAPEGSWRIDLATGEISATEPNLRWGILHVDRSQAGEFRILPRGNLEAPVRRSWSSPDDTIWVSRVGMPWVEQLRSAGDALVVVDTLALSESATMIGVDAFGNVVVAAPDGRAFHRIDGEYVPFGAGRIDEILAGTYIETICDGAGVCTETITLVGSVTSGPPSTSTAMTPRFSPDGQRVARLTFESNLVVNGADGVVTTVMRIDPSSPLPQLLWTPDSATLLAITSQGIVIVGAGGDIRMLRSPFGGGGTHWIEAIGIA